VGGKDGRRCDAAPLAPPRIGNLTTPSWSLAGFPLWSGFLSAKSPSSGTPMPLFRRGKQWWRPERSARWHLCWALECYDCPSARYWTLGTRLRDTSDIVFCPLFFLPFRFQHQLHLASRPLGTYVLYRDLQMILYTLVSFPVSLTLHVRMKSLNPSTLYRLSTHISPIQRAHLD
jgi:hypothetical protein